VTELIYFGMYGLSTGNKVIADAKLPNLRAAKVQFSNIYHCNNIENHFIIYQQAGTKMSHHDQEI